jgi:hypothetical protein
MSDNKENTPYTPVAGARTWTERTPDSDISESPEPKRADILHGHREDIDSLKLWFSNQLSELKADLLTENALLHQEIAAFRDELRQRDDKIFQLDSNLEVLMNKQQDMAAKMSSQDEHIEELENKLDEQKQYSMRHSLRFDGLGPFTNNGDQDYRDLVIKAAKKIDIKLTQSDIDRAHPSGRDQKQLLCKFTNYTARRTVYINRKKFRKHEETKGIFVNENLTPKRYGMFKQLLGLKKQKVVDNTWSNDGRLFVWRNGSKTLLESQADIDALKPLPTD